MNSELKDTLSLSMLALICIASGFIIGYEFKVCAVEKYAHDMGQYEIHYQRCISEPGGNVESCHEVALFKSKVCVGCEK